MTGSNFKKNIIFLALGLTFFGPLSVGAAQSGSQAAPSESGVSSLAAESGKETTYLMCQNGSNVRTIRFLPSKAGGCKTGYTKEGGSEQIVAESWSKSRCFSVMNNIRENLTNANWKCRDISDSRISSSLNE